MVKKKIFLQIAKLNADNQLLTSYFRSIKFYIYKHDDDFCHHLGHQRARLSVVIVKTPQCLAHPGELLGPQPRLEQSDFRKWNPFCQVRITFR